MDFTKINEVGRLENYLPIKRWDDLDVDTDYKVTALAAVKTKYGASIVANIDKEYALYLPARMVKSLEEDAEMFQQLIAEAEKGRLYIHYYGGKYHKCEFLNK